MIVKDPATRATAASRSPCSIEAACSVSSRQIRHEKGRRPSGPPVLFPCVGGRLIPPRLRLGLALATSVRGPWFSTLAPGLAAETDLLRHRATAFRVVLGDHRIVGLQAITLAILGRGQAVGRQMAAQRLVRLAVDQRDDVILGRERLARGDRWYILGRRFGRRSGLAAGVRAARRPSRASCPGRRELHRRSCGCWGCRAKQSSVRLPVRRHWYQWCRGTSVTPLVRVYVAMRNSASTPGPTSYTT